MKFNYSFNNGPYVQIRESQGKSFLMEFGEFYLGNISKPRLLIDHIVNGDATYGIFREWHTNWFINIFQNNDKEGLRLVSSHRYNDSQKNVAIILDTDDLYEARIWLDKCIQYQNKTNANVFVFTKFYSFLHQLGQANVRVCPPEAYFKDPIHKTAYNLESENKFDIPDLSSKEFTWKDDVGYYASYRVGRYSMKEYGLDKYYTNFDPGSGGALDAAIAGAFAKKKPIFTYYWAPTGLMGKVDLVRLTEPKFDSDCWNKMSAVVEDIKANGAEAYKPSCACEYRDMALTKSVLTDWAKANPAETAFLEKYTIPTAVVNKMLAFYEDESDGDMELTAKEFLKTEAMWKSWVPADVASKVTAAL